MILSSLLEKKHTRSILEPSVELVMFSFCMGLYSDGVLKKVNASVFISSDQVQLFEQLCQEEPKSGKKSRVEPKKMFPLRTIQIQTVAMMLVSYTQQESL